MTENFNKEVMKLEDKLELAKNGDAQMQFEVAHHYIAECNGEENETGFKWLEKAVAQGNAEAQLFMGHCYYDGDCCEQDSNKAFELYQKCVEQGNLDGLYNVGVCYMEGIGVEKDLVKAFEVFTASAEYGSANGLLALGDCYCDGIGVEQDRAKAVELYEKSAKLGKIYAQYKLAGCYKNWSGVNKDKQKIRDLYAVYYRDRYESFVRRYNRLIDLSAPNPILANETRTIKIYKCQLDMCCKYDEMMKLIQDGDCEAQFQLISSYYSTGAIEEKETMIAYTSLLQSAEKGDAAAQCYVGICNRCGSCTRQDDKKAVEWLEKSVAQGNIRAHYELAYCYQEGIGTEIDLQKSKELFAIANAVEQKYEKIQLEE